jgi:hypothetical protein
MIWCNPPYGPETKQWLRRMGEHRCGIALVFARTDTEWFHETAASADAILFLNARLKFVDKTGKPPIVVGKDGKKRKSGAGAGSMLVAWGNDCVAALERMNSNPLGQHRGLLVPFPSNEIESLIG